MPNLEAPYLPRPIEPVFAAFPADVDWLMPQQDAIPEDIGRGLTVWNRIFNAWFFDGLPADVEFYPAEGIDPRAALAHIKAIMGSYGPKHEHKERAVAYLMSLWFTRIEKWEKPRA